MREHFEGVELSQIVTAARDFSVTSRVDVDRAVTEFQWPDATLLGVHSPMNPETPTLAHLFTPGPLKGDLPFAVFLGPAMRYGQIGGAHVEVAVPIGDAGAAFSGVSSATSRHGWRRARRTAAASSRWRVPSTTRSTRWYSSAAR